MDGIRGKGEKRERERERLTLSTLLNFFKYKRLNHSSSAAIK